MLMKTSCSKGMFINFNQLLKVITKLIQLLDKKNPIVLFVFKCREMILHQTVHF